MVGVNALARETGAARSTISERMRRGQTADQIRKEMEARKGQLLPMNRSKGQGRPEVNSEYDMVVQRKSQFEEMEGWKLRRQRALAERQEIENALRRGELLPVSYVRQWASRFLIEGRDELMKGPSELQDALANESDPRKCAALLRAWVDRVIAKFSESERLWNKGDAAGGG